MTDSPIDAKLREVDAACPCRLDEYGICEVGCRCCPDSPHYQIPDGVDCTWPGHRLVREVAKVAQERMRYRAYSEQGATVMGRQAWSAYLPLEGVKDG